MLLAIINCLSCSWFLWELPISEHGIIIRIPFWTFSQNAVFATCSDPVTVSLVHIIIDALGVTAYAFAAARCNLGRQRAAAVLTVHLTMPPTDRRVILWAERLPSEHQPHPRHYCCSAASACLMPVTPSSSRLTILWIVWIVCSSALGLYQGPGLMQIIGLESYGIRTARFTDI